MFGEPGTGQTAATEQLTAAVVRARHLQDEQLDRINPAIVEAFLHRAAAGGAVSVQPHAAGDGMFILARADGMPLPKEFAPPGEREAGITALVASPGKSLAQARAGGAAVADAVNLGPSDPPYKAFVALCADVLVNAVLPLATVQTCIIHLIRGSIRYASRKYWDELARDLKPIYQVDTPIAAEAALQELEVKWGNRYPAIIKMWRSASAVGAPPACGGFVPFLDYNIEIRRVICSTNAIASLNAASGGYESCGHFPNEQSAMETLYLVTRSLDPTVKGRARWTMRWVESTRGAVSALLPIRFPGPLAEPGVRLSTHPALHDQIRQAWFVRRYGLGIVLPR